MVEDQIDKLGNHWRVEQWFPKLTPSQLTSLKIYHQELLHFNATLNLISVKSEKNADLVHISDGILGAQAVFSRTNANVIYDLGSGNGVPGIIMAILDPERKFVLVDSDMRKTEFLRHCASKLNLSNVTIECNRVENIRPQSIHCSVSRGFASISKALVLARQASAKDCEYFHFKGPSWSSEMAAIPSQVLSVWDPIHTCDYNLPLGEGTMSIVLTRKTS